MENDINRRYERLQRNLTSAPRPPKALPARGTKIVTSGRAHSDDNDSLPYSYDDGPLHYLPKRNSDPGSSASPAGPPRSEFQRLTLKRQRTPSEGQPSASKKSGSPPRYDHVPSQTTSGIIPSTTLHESRWPHTNLPTRPNPNEFGQSADRYVPPQLRQSVSAPRRTGAYPIGSQGRFSPESPRITSTQSGAHLSRGTTPQKSTLSPTPHGARGYLNSPEATAEHAPQSSIQKQPDSRPISHNQLAAEVKGIYAGLVMVETKCVNVVNAQATALRAKQSGESGPPVEDHWHALIALHRSLLHEHHDFFLASQHPSASPALRELASKYSMPARMWKHGIHNFLELLRHRLPASLDYMLAFIYLAYQMMALLYETVTSFEDTWIECLGDLARYRMAIEDEDLKDREIWTGVARYWYCKAVDKNPMIGRLYHHLAILARTHPLQQLALYSRSLTAVSVFTSTRESIMTLFDPIIARSETSSSRPPSVDIYFVQCQAIIFTKGTDDKFAWSFEKLMSNLDNHIGRVTMKWKEQGMFMAIASFCAMFEYGLPESPLRISFAEKHGLFTDAEKGQAPAQTALVKGQYSSPYDYQAAVVKMVQDRIPLVLRLFFSVLIVALRRVGDLNVLAHVHLDLVFFWSLAFNVEYGFLFLSTTVPWADLANFLNSIIKPDNFNPDILQEAFLTPPAGESRVLPEDWMLRGQIYCLDFLPPYWFEGATADEDERAMEHASTARLRVDRVLWLGVKIANLGIGKYPDHPWLAFDGKQMLFSARSTAPTTPSFHASHPAMAHTSSVSGDVVVNM